MPYLHVTLIPEWDGEKIPLLKVCACTDLPAEAGKKYFSINRVTVFKPFTGLAEPFLLADSSGEIPLEEREEKRPQMVLGGFFPGRDSSGECRLSYSLELAPAGKNPVFDLGYEAGGMTGSGMTFMPAFETDGEIDYVLDWDLSGLPPRAVGAWSFGEGHVFRRGEKDLLQETFYGAGLMDSVRMGNFSYYWFPNDRIAETALTTARIFSYESRFFGDQGDPYTIFTRHAPDLDFERAGGTALTRAYMYLYKDDSQLDPAWLKFLFAHEMVHNWVHLSDMPFGTCTWYVEGMAEYYSAVLPMRMGAVTADELARELNKRSRQYYENPAICETNAACGAGLFADPEKTRVPYGRGFFYLTHADAAVRRATGGKNSLDDVVLELNKRFAGNRELRNEAWLDVYGSFVGGETALREYESFRDGGVVEPATDCFEGRIRAEQTEGKVRGIGQPCPLWVFSAVERS